MVQRVQALCLLWRHVVRGTYGGTHHSEFQCRVGLVLHGAEIEDLDDVAVSRLAEEHIVWLEIPVDQPPRMRRIETDSQLAQHSHESGWRKHRLALKGGTKLLTIQELHDQDVAAVARWPKVKDLDDVLVRKLCADGKLATESLHTDRIRCHVRVQDLQRNIPAPKRVERLVDTPHAPIGNHPSDLVALANEAPETRILMIPGGGSQGGAGQG